MKHNVGDVIRIKSKKWYDENKDEKGDINIGFDLKFTKEMSLNCGKINTIEYADDDSYILKNSGFCWNDYMFEDSIEEPFPEEPLNKFTCLIPEHFIYWEQRRYEIANNALQGICAHVGKNCVSDDVKLSLKYADELIKQLKEKEGK